MAKVCDNPERIEAILASDSIPLTPKQVAALTLELAKPKYDGRTTSEVLVALRDPQVVEVAETRAWRKFRGWELKKFLNASINQLSEATLEGDASAQKWLVVLGAQLAKTLDTDVLDPEIDETLTGLAGQMVSAGLATPERRDELLTSVEPAHNESAPCPLEAMVDESGNRLFPDGLALEPADVEACRG